MTQGWPAGRIDGKSPWCRSTLFSYKTLIFPARTVFWCFGVFKEADTWKRLFFLFLFLFYYNTGGLLAETPMTSRLDSWISSITTSMKLTGNHKPLCLHYLHKSIHTNYLGAPKEYLLVWGTRPPRRRAVVTNTPHHVSVHHHVSPTLRIICHHPSRPAPEFRLPMIVRFPIYVYSSFIFLIF